MIAGNVGATSSSVDHAMVCALGLSLGGDAARGASLLTTALTAAEPGNAGWLLPIDPLIGVQRRIDVWAAPLAVLHERTFAWVKFDD